MTNNNVVFDEVIDGLFPLIQSNHYEENKWEELKAKFQSTYKNPKLQSHLTAIQLLQQKSDFLKFSTSTFEILHQINLEVASLAPITDILNLSAARLKDISKAHLVLIGMIDKEKSYLRVEAIAGEMQSELLNFEESLDSNFQSELLNNEEPFIILDISTYIHKESTFLNRLSEKGIVSLICSPLIVHGERIGAIFLARTVTYHSNRILLQMLENYCYQTALALSNAKLYSNEVRVGELHKELFEEALNKGGNEGILQRVSNFIEEPILLLDEYGNSIYEAIPRQYKSPESNFHHIELYKVILKSDQNLQNSFEITNQGDYYSIFTIHLHDRIVAYLILSRKLNSYDQLSIVAIEQAKNVLALQINQEKTSIEVENRLRQDYLHDLISGLETEENLLRRARYLNISFDTSHSILVLAPSENNGDFSIYLNHILDKFRYMIDRELLPLSMVQGQKIILITPDEYIKSVLNFAMNYTDKKYPNLTFRVGVSDSLIHPKDYIRGFNEAKKAADFAHSFQFKSAVVHFKELGIIGLLFNTENPAYMKEFMERYLSKVIEYDQQNKSDLLTTLEVFLDNESAIQTSAQKLHIHYNTLRYRLNRLEEILEIDLTNTQNRLNLQVAIIINRLVNQL